jgi:tetratricopeptide (TPR) repeat protein
MANKIRSARGRRALAAAGALLALWCAVPRAAAQEAVSPLPPPVTRSLYRSRWFEFLNAHLEDDSKGAASALAEMKKAARAVGVRRLSDFSRTAVHEGRKAEGLGKLERAARAYDAAVQLDDASYDAIAARIGFLARHGSWIGASRLIPDAVSALFETREPRLSLASSLAVWTAFAIGATLAGAILALLGKNAARMGHDARELARRFGGVSVAAIVLVLAVLPLAVGLGPGWLFLYWGVILFPYALPRERALLAAGFVLLGLLTPLLAAMSRENVIERSPLFIAAVDLEERREDASAEDGLRQASGVFAEDPDVWFLLGMYADRSGDSERAIRSYERAIQAEPRDFRPYLNRGNVHFQEGDYPEAIRDYEAAAQRAPRAAEIQYNLSIARGEAYDFEGQTAAMARARALSDTSVVAWTEHPTIARVISAGYPLSRARVKVEQWNRQPKSRRLPGHAPPLRLAGLALSPFAIGPWTALAAALGLAGYRSRRAIATECARCGVPVCDSCRRFGDHPLYCTTCVRFHVRKENPGIEAQVAQAKQMRRRVRARDRLCHLVSFVIPGTHRIFSDRTFAGALAMFVFFFFLSVAVVGGRFFDPRQLPPQGPGHLTAIAPALVALLVWAGSLGASLRNSHGS